MPLPAEIVLDRWVRDELRKDSKFSAYIGKLDLETVEPPALRSYLYLIQASMNEALRLEGVNAPGGVEHPPFHFDYLAVSSGVANAHAFQVKDFAFIVVTLPVVELLWALSSALSRSPMVAQTLGLGSETRCGDFQALLFHFQLAFLVSHEYTHHVHRHCVGVNGAVGVWTEFLDDVGSLDAQAQELDADGFAAYLVVTHFLRGPMRPVALATLGREGTPQAEADEVLLACYLLGVITFFCACWRGATDISSVYTFNHPPPPVRIKYLFPVVEMWCGQNSVSWAWMTVVRGQELFRRASEIFSPQARQAWDAEMAFLRSEIGTKYDNQLFERFEIARRRRA